MVVHRKIEKNTTGKLKIAELYSESVPHKTILKIVSLVVQTTEKNLKFIKNKFLL